MVWNNDKSVGSSQFSKDKNYRSDAKLKSVENSIVSSPG